MSIVELAKQFFVVKFQHHDEWLRALCIVAGDGIPEHGAIKLMSDIARAGQRLRDQERILRHAINKIARLTDDAISTQSKENLESDSKVLSQAINVIIDKMEQLDQLRGEITKRYHIDLTPARPTPRRRVKDILSDLR